MPNFSTYANFAGALTGDGVVGELERRFTALLHGKLRCLSMINATSALAPPLSCLPRGRIIAPLFTSPATYAAIRHAGHEAVFCDIDPVSACLSPFEAERRLDRDVRAIITVNIFGHPGHLIRLRELARGTGAMLIVDAAQSLGSCLGNPESVCLADAVVFSLGPAKLTGCADGGMVAVREAELWEQLVLKTQHTYRQMLDVPARAPDFEHYNYRINPHSAARALHQLKYVGEKLARIRKRQQRLISRLERCGQFEPLPHSPGILFEPLTALPLKEEVEGWVLHELPIPDRLQAVVEHQLPETLRQFRYRKVVLPVKINIKMRRQQER